VALAREWDVTLVLPSNIGFLGSAFALSGRTAEGLALLQDAVKTLESRVSSFLSLILVQLGEVYLLAARIEDARASAGRALALARKRGERGYEAYALRLLGEITSRGDPPEIETADTHYHQAMALGEALGMRPLVAHCHLGLGRLYRRTGKPQPAQEHLTGAVGMFREMDMGFWLERGEAEVKGLG